MPAPKSSIQPAPLHLPQVPPELAVPVPPQKDAGDVEFDGRLGEREIAGAETRFHAFAEELLHEIVDGAGEIAEGDVRIHGEAFDLMEHEGVRRIRIIAAIDLARHDHAHGRLALLHGANLHGRSVRAQKKRTRRAFRQFQVERVHVIAHG